MPDVNPYTGSTPLGGAYNPNYDPASRFKPVAPGTHVARVTMSDPDTESRWTKKSDPERGDYYWAKPKAEIVEGDAAGRTVFGFVSTQLNDQGGSGAHEIVIAAGLSHRLAECQTHEDLCALVDEALEGEGAEMNVYIDWNAPLRRLDGTFDYSDRIRGWKNFPKDEDGNPMHTFDKKDDEGEVIGQYVASAEAKYFRAA